MSNEKHVVTLSELDEFAKRLQEFTKEYGKMQLTVADFMRGTAVEYKSKIVKEQCKEPCGMNYCDDNG